MRQHIIFLVLTPFLWAPAVRGTRARADNQDLEIQVKGKTGSITEEKCGTVVSEVQKSKSYTEESIRPICDREIKSSRCDFFAEALSLASSHSEFEGKGFCEAIVSSQFCAQTMDRLLTSQAMADLARGDCNRSPNTKGYAYCEKFQKMLAYSVQNDDLDTMRACYMMEAYSELGTASNATNHTEGHTESAANKTKLVHSHDSPKVRIISSSSKDLDSVTGDEHTPHMTALPSNETKPTSEAPEGDKKEIVVEPVSADNKDNKEITAEPVVADDKSNASSIATDPVYLPDKNAEIPATEKEASELQPIGEEVKGTQPAATVPAATVSTAVTQSHQIPEVRLNIGGFSNLLSTKAKAQLAAKSLKRNASQTSGDTGSNTSQKVTLSNASHNASAPAVSNSSAF